MNNLIERGSEEKYRKIRMNNKAFQVSICWVIGYATIDTYLMSLECDALIN